MDEHNGVVLAVAGDVGDGGLARFGEVPASATERALLEEMPDAGRVALA